jgi:acyl carrier protein
MDEDVAGGIAFMTSGHVWAADGFFVGGTALFLAKFWTWEDARRQPPPRKWALQAAVTMLSLGLALGAILWNHAINYPPAVIQSRQSPTQPGRSASQTGQPAGGKTQAAKSDSRKITGESIPTDESTTEEQTITTSERVKVIIARQLQVDASQVKDSDDFEMDLGADPGDVYFLMRSLELEYNITIPDRDSKNLHTVGETIDYIERREHEKR